MATANTSSPESPIDTTVPEELTTTGSKLVYLHISANTKTTINDLQDDLDMKKLTLYSILNTLKTENLITQTGDTYRSEPESHAAD